MLFFGFATMQNWLLKFKESVYTQVCVNNKKLFVSFIYIIQKSYFEERLHLTFNTIETFLKISYFVLHIIRPQIQFLNNMKVDDSIYFYILLTAGHLLDLLLMNVRGAVPMLKYDPKIDTFRTS